MDVSTAGWRFWNRGYERWQHIWGPYWLNFGITIIALVLFIILLCALCFFIRDNKFTYSIMTLKVLLAIIGFFMVFYVVMVILILAGQTALATFCTVLA
jgi:hypothetical protein